MAPGGLAWASGGLARVLGGLGWFVCDELKLVWIAIVSFEHFIINEYDVEEAVYHSLL